MCKRLWNSHGWQHFFGASVVLAVGVFLTLVAPAVRGATRTAEVLARGGGTTMIEGGTGRAGGFIPVLTTLAFHAEVTGGTVTGSFECLARGPQTSTGPGSAQFTTNVMYVTGQIKTATIHRNIARLSGTANITGLGAGAEVPFTFVVRKGGPGAAAVLTTEGLTPLVFNEVLLEGSFEVVADE